MSDIFDDIFGEDDELEAILSEAKDMNDSKTESVTENQEESVGGWSMDDIDRLIAGEDVEKSSEDSDFDFGMFSIKPITEATDVVEMQDVSSGEEEVEGQEMFFDDEPEEFSFDLSDLETVVIPEEEQAAPESKYAKPVRREPEFSEVIDSEPVNVAGIEETEVDAEESPEEVDEPKEFESLVDFPEPSAWEQPMDYEKESALINKLFEEGILSEEEESHEEPAAETEPAENTQESSIVIEEIIEETETAEEQTDETPEKTEEEKIADYRTKFYERIKVDEPEEEEETPEGPIDKSGFVVRKNEGKADEDLDIVPTIVAAEDVGHNDSDKTKIVKEGTKKPETFEDDDVEGQIVLTGFSDIPDDSAPEQSNENDVEASLWTRRKQKAKNFKIEGIDDEGFGEGFDDIEAEEERYRNEAENNEEVEDDTSDSPAYKEYTNPSERNSFYDKLAVKVEKAKKSLILTGIIAAVMLIVSLIPSVVEKLQIESKLFSGESMVLCVFQALLLIVCVALDSERFFDSLTGLIKGKITSGTAVSLSLAVDLFENTLAAVFISNEVPVFSAVAVMGVVLLKAADYMNAKRIYGNFSVCAFNYEHNMYAVHSFDNESEVFELGRGLLMGNADMLYSSNVLFPSDFMKKSKEEYDESKYDKITLIASTAAALIGAIVSLIAVEDAKAITAFSVFTGCFCISVPALSAFVSAFITRFANHKLNSEGTMIASLTEAEKISQANAVVIDSADIFDRDKCTMYGMKGFHTLRTDAVLLYASAMVIKSGGPLKECFEKVVDGRQDLLPPVRELVYEDKMGISARIYDQKVLLGNRNMLIHHNINAPDKSIEDKYLHNGHKVIYLACNEQLAALFVVGYSIDEALKPQLKRLQNNGIQVLVRTNDVNVTEKLISSSFDLSENNFKILSSVAGRLYKRRKDTINDSLPAGVIHDGKANSMIKAISSACSMVSGMKIGRILRAVLSVLGLILGVVIACVGENGLTAASAALIMLGEIGITTGTLFVYNK